MRDKQNISCLGRNKAKNDLTAERERALRHSIDILNHLLASPAQPRPERLLRRILLQRVAARVNKNSLPDLF